MIIGSHDTARRPLLIAEIGNNHEGDPALAFDLAFRRSHAVSCFTIFL